MTLELKRNPYIFVKANADVELRIEPYTRDRVHFQVTRYVTTKKGNVSTTAREVVTYFDIKLDELGEIYGLLLDMFADRLEWVA